ncbi:MAG: hypothetical protein JKY56_14500 [Kofleriaceae bacterium]|nr:hypothetical protein [Kofleriaceae bacterium]
MRSSSQAVLAEDRNILGAPGTYPADTSLRARTAELNASQKLRREAAWQSVAKLLQPVEFGQTIPNLSSPNTIPLWQSFYGNDEAERLFLHLFEGLSPAERSSQTRFTPVSIDDAFGWNVNEVEGLANWPEERRLAYLEAIDSNAKLTGIAGVDQVGINPPALRHIVSSYPEILRCIADAPPDASDEGPGQSVQEMLRVPLSLAACEEAQLFGPFALSQGETLQASFSGSGQELGGATLSVHANSPTGQMECESDTRCEVSGEREYYVRVLPGPEPLSAALQVDYKSPSSNWSSCLNKPFSTDSVIVKASWNRIFASNTLPTYKTSADALRRRLADNDTEGWGQEDGTADPGPDAIYTMELPNGQRYRLTGLHIMTKELDHWQWISLWWSDEPDLDFGQDRPQSIDDLEGPWSNYKMCAVSKFNESDPLPGGGFEQSAPDLANALTSVYQGVGQPSWCSNPYIEEGSHNMATNCIGCHQHGGTTIASEDIIGMPTLYPQNGRSQVRNNFPQDYSWVISRGEQLGLYFKEVVAFFGVQE